MLPLPLVRGLALIFLLGTLALTEGRTFAGGLPVELEIDVSFKEPSFHLLGPITAQVEFRNRSAKDIVINKAFNFQDCKLEFHITTPSGATPHQIQFLLGRRPLLGPRDFQKIPAGKTFQVEIDLAKWFELSEEGIYKVKVEYSNKYAERQLGTNVWTGKIASSIQTFQLTKP